MLPTFAPGSPTRCAEYEGAHHFISALASVGHHDLDDVVGGQQAPKGLACRSGESGALACMDRRIADMGHAPHESRALDRLRAKSLALEVGMNPIFFAMWWYWWRGL